MRQTLPFPGYAVSSTALAVAAGLLFAGCSPDTEDAADTAEESRQLPSLQPEHELACPVPCAKGMLCDGAVGECVAEPLPPTIVFPISGAITTGLPALSFSTASSATKSMVEICQDAACTRSVALLSGVSQAALPAPLPRGTYFIRAWGVRKAADGHLITGTVKSPTRVFRSSGRPVTSKSALAWFSDFNADGIADNPVSTSSSVQPAVSKVDGGRVSAGGQSQRTALAVPDMDGDGRTELAQLRSDASGNAKLVLSRLSGTAVAERELDISSEAELLLLGDVDRDGYFDLGTARPLADGVRLEIFYGGPTLVDRRRTVDVRMPAERMMPTAYVSVSAIGDIDGDGYPDLALGGRANTEVSPWNPTIPRSGTFPQGLADSYRFYLFLGAKTRPFTTALPPFVSEGNALAGISPVGDVNGDGFMDLMAIDSLPTAIVEYEADPYSSGHWNLRTRDYRPGLVFMVYGGSPLRKEQWMSPSFFREGPTPPGTGIGKQLIGTYEEVKGISTSSGGRTREQYFFSVSFTGAGDWNQDGYFDVAFGMLGAQQPAPSAGEAWDLSSDPKYLREYTFSTSWPGTVTWRRFAAFVDVRYGSAAGLGQTPAELVLSPSTERTPSLIRWVGFPAIEARTNGIFIAEWATNLHMSPPPVYPFAGTFAGPPGHLMPVP